MFIFQIKYRSVILIYFYDILRFNMDLQCRFIKTKNVYTFIIFSKMLIYKFKTLKRVCDFFFKLTKNIVKTRIKTAYMKESFLHTSWIYVTKLKHKDWYSIMENLSHSNIRNTTTMAKKKITSEADFHSIYKHL